MVLHRPVELARIFGMWHQASARGKKPHSEKRTSRDSCNKNFKSLGKCARCDLYRIGKLKTKQSAERASQREEVR